MDTWDAPHCSLPLLMEGRPFPFHDSRLCCVLSVWFPPPLLSTGQNPFSIIKPACCPSPQDFQIFPYSVVFPFSISPGPSTHQVITNQPCNRDLLISNFPWLHRDFRRTLFFRIFLPPLPPSFNFSTAFPPRSAFGMVLVAQTFFLQYHL